MAKLKKRISSLRKASEKIAAIRHRNLWKDKSKKIGLKHPNRWSTYKKYS